jgi:hypothetical protein
MYTVMIYLLRVLSSTTGTCGRSKTYVEFETVEIVHNLSQMSHSLDLNNNPAVPHLEFKIGGTPVKCILLNDFWII